MTESGEWEQALVKNKLLYHKYLCSNKNSWISYLLKTHLEDTELLTAPCSDKN